ncbi:DUF887-domain-containing protein [Choiromyces venosus 120613-1]|uniref:DUF887-domain-containing protein n=1 Tax=Choiromyces venosus 120613-1 TaxID=1336337 RepID=A0A3N4JQM9_9PEZI|nr:DUF887-domain-containing protein [Choiromyces venosus 120613-1]
MASSILFAPCPPALTKLVEPYATKIGLHTLPLHIHQVIAAFVVYHFIFAVISPILSSTIFPTIYRNFDKRTKVNWNVHVVSFAQSTFICILAIWAACNDPERDAWSKDEAAMLKRTFGYSEVQGAVQAYAEGYFIWDLFMSAWHLDIFGLGFLAHAASAVMVFSLGFRPFVNYWASVFVLFEISSPFLNIHWFCDKTGMTGSLTQLINGFFLLTSFFCCRLVWGTWNAFLVFGDLKTLYPNPSALLPPAPTPVDSLLPDQDDHLKAAEVVVSPFAGKTLPLWLIMAYLGSNSILNLLNYYWFSRMIQTVTARFTKDKPVKKGKMEKKEKKEESVEVDANGKVWVEGTDVDIGTTAEVAKEKLKKRTVTRQA